MALPSSVRYDRLLKVLDQALTAARNEVNLEEAVKEAYGDDGENNKVFCTLLNSVLEQVNTTVRADVIKAFEEHEVKEKFIKLEAAIDKARRDAEKKQQDENKDKNSAAQAAADAKTEVQPSDLLRHRMYKRSMERKTELLDEIGKLEQEIEDLESQKEQRSAEANNVIGQIEQSTEKLRESANGDFTA